jgi:hypothetical protein
MNNLFSNLNINGHQYCAQISGQNSKLMWLINYPANHIFTKTYKSQFIFRNINNIVICKLQRCQRICLQLAFEERCNCSHPTYMDLPTGFGPCNLTSSSKFSKQRENSIIKNIIFCQRCHALSLYQYQTTIIIQWITNYKFCATWKSSGIIA